MSKLSQISKLARDNKTADKTVEADRLHTMFLAMADARAVLIKLADRLHNMTTLEALPQIKQQRFAKETSEIFVPLANRLGASSWKEQLENLCFRHLNHDQYQELSSKLVKFFDEAVITSSVDKLEQALKKGAVSYYSLSGRHKSLFGIYSKMSKYDLFLVALSNIYTPLDLPRCMLEIEVCSIIFFGVTSTNCYDVTSCRKKVNMEEVHDIHGLRLIVETREDCYKALKIVHHLWHEVPGRFKDYIVYPKCNGYALF